MDVDLLHKHEHLLSDEYLLNHRNDGCCAFGPHLRDLGQADVVRNPLDRHFVSCKFLPDDLFMLIYLNVHPDTRALNFLLADREPLFNKRNDLHVFIARGLSMIRVAPKITIVNNYPITSSA